MVASPGGEAVLTAHAVGTVVRVFRRLGEPARAGETLALVESREAALATSILAREKRLFEQGVTARQDYETAKAEAEAAAAWRSSARSAARSPQPRPPWAPSSSLKASSSASPMRVRFRSRWR